MIKQLLAKWFGLDLDVPCETCEVLREQLQKSDSERSELLHRLLDRDKPEPPLAIPEEFKPVKPQFTPWRVRQQLLEQEDRKQAELLKKKAQEISELENELGINNAS